MTFYHNPMSSEHTVDNSRMRRRKVYLFIAFGCVPLIIFTFFNSSKIEIHAKTVTEKKYLDTTQIMRKAKTTQKDPVKPGVFEAKCSDKKYNVAFLKVHKAGSSTVQNIFLRFAIGYNLNIVLPKNSTGYGFNYLGYGTTVNKSKLVPLPGNETYNILCNHVVYNKKAFDSVMPPGSVYVGIVREPKSHFISASMYYGLYKTLKKLYNTTSENPGETLSRFLNEYTRIRRKVPLYYVHNRMSFDFGLSPQFFRNPATVEAYIKKLDSEFGIVMLMEYFDESLVLLKRRLCWDLKDILYIPLNVNKRKRTLPIALSSSAEKNLYYFDYADFQLYKHFSTRFKSEVTAEGQDFRDEVMHFKRQKEKVTAYCFGKDKRDLVIQESKWNPMFTVSWEDCIEMKMPELKMVGTLIREANARYQDWFNHEQLSSVKKSI